MPSKKSLDTVGSAHARALMVLAAGLMCLAGPGCKKTSRAPAESGTAPAPEKAAPASKPPAGKKAKRKRLPPPLTATRGLSAAAQDPEQRPCLELVNKVCALLSEGAEECGEARLRVKRRPGTVNETRCAEALDWYTEHVEQVRKVYPCALLAEVKCKTWGAESIACVNAQADAEHLAKTFGTGCQAELLLFKGIP